jgi:hypothetical protein
VYLFLLCLPIENDVLGSEVAVARQAPCILLFGLRELYVSLYYANIFISPILAVPK